MNFVVGADRADLVGRAAVTSSVMAALSSVFRVPLSDCTLQLADAVQHRVHLGEGTLSRLDERDAVLRVALSLRQAGDLSAHLLRDGEAGSVVGGAVDAVAGRQLLHRLGRLGTTSPSRLRWALNASTLFWMRRAMCTSP